MSGLYGLYNGNMPVICQKQKTRLRVFVCSSAWEQRYSSKLVRNNENSSSLSKFTLNFFNYVINLTIFEVFYINLKLYKKCP